MNRLGLFLGPSGHLLTHLHTVYVAYYECIPTYLNPLAERTCFSQVDNGCLNLLKGSHVLGRLEHADHGDGQLSAEPARVAAARAANSRGPGGNMGPLCTPLLRR